MEVKGSVRPFDSIVKKRIIIIAAIALLALAFIPIPSQVTPKATVHVVDDAGEPVAGVSVYRSWEHFGLRREGHQNSETSKFGDTTFAAEKVWGSVLLRALAPALALISPHASTGARTHFEIYCPVGYQVRPGDVAAFRSSCGGQVSVDYDAPHPKSSVQYSAVVRLDFDRRDPIEFTLRLGRNGVEKP